MVFFGFTLFPIKSAFQKNSLKIAIEEIFLYFYQRCEKQV